MPSPVLFRVESPSPNDEGALSVLTRNKQIGTGRYDCLRQGAFSSFDLRPRADGFGDQRAGGPYKTERFFDFMVDGVSLYDALGCSRDLISALRPSVVPSEGGRAIRRPLLADGDARGNRVSLFICPECGDLGCGAIIVRIERHDSGIVWRGIGDENIFRSSKQFCLRLNGGPTMKSAHEEDVLQSDRKGPADRDRSKSASASADLPAFLAKPPGTPLFILDSGFWRM